MKIYKLKYIQHWFMVGGITNKVILVLASSAWAAKDIVELDLKIGSVYGLITEDARFEVAL